MQSCQQDTRQNVNNVTIWEIDDPPTLHPLLAFDATANIIKPLVFQSLLNFDYQNHELIPVLAQSRPEIKMQGDSAMNLTYEIREEAMWDDGTSITAADVVFSFKAAATPSVNAHYFNPYISMVERFECEESDPKQITIHIGQKHMRAEASTGYEMPILPKHIFDPNRALDSYSFQELLQMDEVTDTALAAFGQRMNSEAFARDGDQLLGSGAYKLNTWKSGQHILLERKANWWGRDVANANMYFEARPDSITFEIINDQTAALTALKGGQLDVMRSVKAKDFDQEMKGNEQVLKRYNLHNPPKLAYSALGINMEAPIFQSKRTRQAMAQLTDYQRLIEDVMQGYGNRTIGPVFPSMEQLYNDTIQRYQYDPGKAKQLLQADGWRDDNGDGILEKSIDGEMRDFAFDFIINKGQQERETVALILQEDLREAGIKMNIKSLDWGVVVRKLQSGDFDMMYLALESDPAPEDYTQLWSTASQNGGYNFVNFGNAKTDSLLHRINRTLDEDKRADLIKRFQEIIHEQVPYIYLWNPTNRMAISKRFENTRVSLVRPGFWVPGFTLK